MKSYKEIYKKLPEEFIESVSSEYNANDLDRILAGYMVERPVTLRVNSLKTDVRKVMEKFRRDNIKFERVLWYNDALIVTNKHERELSEHELYKEGHIYLQSLSSMLPPLILKPAALSKVLDLTAAPGGKSTQMAAMMGNEGFILSNEINGIRAERLKFNVERQRAKIIEVRIGDGKRLEEKYHEFFDYALLDAPCTGAGTFIAYNPRSYRGWSLKNCSRLSREQKKLLETAIWALKPGGILVYSTCSLMRAENEENMEWLMENMGDSISFERIDLDLKGKGLMFRYENLSKYKDCMLLIFPSELYEGFFVCRMKKKA